MSTLLGQRLGDYRLHSLLEHGNIVDSYLGEHVRAGGGATLKVFKVPLPSADMGTWQRAVRRITALAHPHIPRILDFDISGGLAFLVTDTTATSLRQFHLARRSSTRMNRALCMAIAGNASVEPAEMIRWSPNGKLIAALAQNLQIWEGGH